MSPASWLLVLSLTGAAAFFLAGHLAARARGAPASALRELSSLRSEHAVALDDRHRLGDEVLRLTAAVRAAAHTSVPAAATPAQSMPALPLPLSPYDIDVMKRRLADAAEVEAENARLRAASSDSASLRARVGELERELATVSRRATATQLGVKQGPGAAALAATMSRGGLEGLVRHLAADPSVSAAVVSDELGLLVAGAGEGAEEMAAAAGYLAGVGDRTGALTHLGTATRIVVEDEQGAQVTATRLPGSPLVAITVTRPRAPTLKTA